MTALSAEQPYPGLRPFDLGDEEYFFGREAQTRALREKLKVCRLIAVVGRSGCGKSSLVRAGLVPLLLRESAADDAPNWRIATFRPQGRPLRELGDALLRLKAETRRGAAENPRSAGAAGEPHGRDAPPHQPRPHRSGARTEPRTVGRAADHRRSVRGDLPLRRRARQRRRRGDRVRAPAALRSERREPARLRHADHAARFPRRLRALSRLARGAERGSVPGAEPEPRRAARRDRGAGEEMRRDDQSGGDAAPAERDRRRSRPASRAAARADAHLAEGGRLPGGRACALRKHRRGRERDLAPCR